MGIITWQNVGGADLNGPLNGIRSAADLFNRAGDSARGVVTDMSATNAQVEALKQAEVERQVVQQALTAKSASDLDKMLQGGLARGDLQDGTHVPMGAKMQLGLDARKDALTKRETEADAQTELRRIRERDKYTFEQNVGDDAARAVLGPVLAEAAVPAKFNYGKAVDIYLKGVPPGTSQKIVDEGLARLNSIYQYVDPTERALGKARLDDYNSSKLADEYLVKDSLLGPDDRVGRIKLVDELGKKDPSAQRKFATALEQTGRSPGYGPNYLGHQPIFDGKKSNSFSPEGDALRDEVSTIKTAFDTATSNVLTDPVRIVLAAEGKQGLSSDQVTQSIVEEMGKLKIDWTFGETNDAIKLAIDLAAKADPPINLTPAEAGGLVKNYAGENRLLTFQNFAKDIDRKGFPFEAQARKMGPARATAKEYRALEAMRDRTLEVQSAFDETQLKLDLAKSAVEAGRDNKSNAASVSRLERQLTQQAERVTAAKARLALLMKDAQSKAEAAAADIKKAGMAPQQNIAGVDANVSNALRGYDP